ncbi:MAG: hypothetical protein AB7J28_06540 [Hyphomonadaceae bacterium]
MAEAALVDADLRKGRDFVMLMDRIGVSVRAAFWFFYPDNDRWRLVVVSDEATAGSRNLYLRAIQAGSPLDVASVEFQPPSSPLYKALGRLVRLQGLGEVRLTRNMINGIYIEDAIVYRLT